MRVQWGMMRYRTFPPDIYRDESTGRMMVNWGGMGGREPLEEDYPGEHDGNRGMRGP